MAKSYKDSFHIQIGQHGRMRQDGGKEKSKLTVMSQQPCFKISRKQKNSNYNKRHLQNGRQRNMNIFIASTYNVQHAK